jgi:hypothetical protein
MATEGQLDPWPRPQGVSPRHSARSTAPTPAMPRPPSWYPPCL